MKPAIKQKVVKQMSAPSSLDQFIELMAGVTPRKERTSEAAERRAREGTEPTAFEIWETMIAESMPLETQRVWQKAAWLEAFVECGSKSGACRIVRTNLQTVKKWELQDIGFAAALEMAQENVVDDLEEEAIRRGKEKSDNLLMFMIKTKRPKEHVEKSEVKHTFTIESARTKLKARLGEMAHRKQVAADNSIGQLAASDIDDLVEIVDE